MTYHIALAGKGSSGKSTLVFHLVSHFIYTVSPSPRILVVDADPNGTASFLVGAPTGAPTIGALRSQYEREFKTGVGVAIDVSREEYAEEKMGEEALIELNGFHLLTMGRWDLAGSQCAVNRVLERSLATIAKRYDVVITDYEAGLEPLGRYAAIPIDHLLMIATPDLLSLRVASEIWGYCRRIGRDVRDASLLLNRVASEGVPDGLLEKLTQISFEGLPLAGTLHESKAISDWSQGKTLVPSGDDWQRWKFSVSQLSMMLFRDALPTMQVKAN